MRISDWSSDVCSSDLAVTAAISGALPAEARDPARSPGTDPPATLSVPGMWPGLRLQAARGINEAVGAHPAHWRPPCLEPATGQRRTHLARPSSALVAGKRTGPDLPPQCRSPTI